MDIQPLSGQIAEAREVRAFAEGVMSNQEWLCSPRVSEPPDASVIARMVNDGFIALAAMDDDVMVGWVIARPNGTIQWFVAEPDGFGEVAQLLVEVIHTLAGDCRGQSDNPVVLKAFADAGYVVDPPWITYPEA